MINTNFNNISNNEKNRILEMHINRTKKQYLSEALAGGSNTTERPAQEKFTSSDVKMLSGQELFPTGSDKIDTKGSEFQGAVSDLKSLPQGTKVEVQGGASSVGSDRGYDNQALAFRRAKNFVNALIKSGVDNINFVIIKGEVGNATKYNSPEALSQQFVKYAKVKTLPGYEQTTAIETTATKLPYIEKVVGPLEQQLYKIEYEIMYDPKNKQYFKEIDKIIKSALDGKVYSIKNKKFK